MGRFFDAILDGAFAGFWKVPGCRIVCSIVSTGF